VPMPGQDLAGEQVQRAQVACHARRGRVRPRISIMIAPLHRKHGFNESDKGVVERWAETHRRQYFSGFAYHEDCKPCDATNLVKFRQLRGEEWVEGLLAQTINVVGELKQVELQELTRVVVDSTVQYKSTANPTDGRPLEMSRAELVDTIKDPSIGLKQTFAEEGKAVGSKASSTDAAVRQAPGEALNKAQRIVDLAGQRKAATWFNFMILFGTPLATELMGLLLSLRV